MIQVINTHLEHWNTMNQEDVEGLPENIEAIKEIAVREFTVIEADGTPFATPGGFPAKFEDVGMPSADLKSYVALEGLNDGAQAVEFFTAVITPGFVRVAWYDQLYAAAGVYDTEQTLHAISTTPSVIPIANIQIEVAMALAANAITVVYANSYRVQANFIWSSVGVNSEFAVQSRINGTPVGSEIRIQTDNQTTTQAFGFGGIVTLSAGDVFDLIVTQLGGVAFPSAEIEHMDISLDNVVGEGRVWTGAEFRALIVTPE
jgi:hypothetical protein